MLVSLSGCEPVGHEAIVVASPPSEATGPGQGRIAPPPLEQPEWLLGSTHVHTAASRDSRAPVDAVVKWYEEHGYGFVVLTDHDHVTRYERESELVVVPGAELTFNTRRCLPRSRHKCRIHVNALFAHEHASGPVAWHPRGIEDRTALYEHAIQAVAELDGLPQINHPNLGWGMTAERLVELADGVPLFLEIANAQFQTWNRGSMRHPSTEALWDAALTAGARVFGVAVDDAHQYTRPKDRFAPGGGFVAVRAERNAAAIRAAMLAGEFYASSGVRLRRADREGDALVIEVADDSPGEHVIELIATGGQRLQEVRGRRAHFELPASGYARARVTRDDGARAWTQPIWPTAEDAGPSQ